MKRFMQVSVWTLFAGFAWMSLLILGWGVNEIISMEFISKEILVGIGLVLSGLGLAGLMLGDWLSKH